MATTNSVSKDSTAKVSTTVKDSLATDSTKMLSTAKVDKSTLGYNKPLMSYFMPNTMGLGGSSCIVGLVDKVDTASVNTILNKYKELYPSEIKFAWGFKAYEEKVRPGEDAKKH